MNLKEALVWTPNELTAYRWLPRSANYGPVAPFAAVNRFGYGQHPTLYVSGSATGAICEFLRLHPEFIELQDGIDVRFYEISFNVAGTVLDVRVPRGQALAGITAESLTSSDADETIRWAECWRLADESVAAGHTGIAYPTAASTRDAEWNLVFLENATVGGWSVVEVRESVLPTVLAADVRLVEAA